MHLLYCLLVFPLDSQTPPRIPSYILRKSIYIYIYIWICMYICNICMYIYIDVCVYVYMYVCMYACNVM